MRLPCGLNSSNSDYRWNFQNQEKDKDKETGYINYKYRLHDPRIGRFFAIDPLASKYPYYSSYQFSGNRVIDMIELEGLEPTFPQTLQEWNSSRLKTSNNQSIRDWWNFEGTASVKGFNSNDYDRFTQYINLNYERKKEGESYQELNYKGKCRYNCVNNANAAFQILLNKYDLPVKPNYRQLLTAMANKGLAGNESEIWASYTKLDGTSGKHLGYPNMGTITGFQSSIGGQLLGEAQNVGVGYHFFGVEIGDGFHSVIASVYYDEDGDVEFGIYDQNASTALRSGISQQEFDDWFVNYMNVNSQDKNDNWVGLGKENYGVEHKTVIRSRMIKKNK